MEGEIPTTFCETQVELDEGVIETYLLHLDDVEHWLFESRPHKFRMMTFMK